MEGKDLSTIETLKALMVSNKYFLKLFDSVKYMIHGEYKSTARRQDPERRTDMRTRRLQNHEQSEGQYATEMLIPIRTEHK